MGKLQSEITEMKIMVRTSKKNKTQQKGLAAQKMAPEEKIRELQDDLKETSRKQQKIGKISERK